MSCILTRACIHHSTLSICLSLVCQVNLQSSTLEYSNCSARQPMGGRYEQRVLLVNEQLKAVLPSNFTVVLSRDSKQRLCWMQVCLYLFFHLLDSLVCCILLLCWPSRDSVQDVACQHATPSPEPRHSHCSISSGSRKCSRTVTEVSGLPHLSKVYDRHGQRSIHVCTYRQEVGLLCNSRSATRLGVTLVTGIAPKMTPFTVFLAFGSAAEDIGVLRGLSRTTECAVLSIAGANLPAIVSLYITENDPGELPCSYFKQASEPRLEQGPRQVDRGEHSLF